MSEDPRAHGERMADALLPDGTRLDLIAQAIGKITAQLRQGSMGRLQDLEEMADRLALDHEARHYFRGPYG